MWWSISLFILPSSLIVSLINKRTIYVIFQEEDWGQQKIGKNRRQCEGSNSWLSRWKVVILTAWPTSIMAEWSCNYPAHSTLWATGKPVPKTDPPKEILFLSAEWFILSCSSNDLIWEVWLLKLAWKDSFTFTVSVSLVGNFYVQIVLFPSLLTQNLQQNPKGHKLREKLFMFLISFQVLIPRWDERFCRIRLEYRDYFCITWFSSIFPILVLWSETEWVLF